MQMHMSKADQVQMNPHPRPYSRARPHTRTRPRPRPHPHPPPSALPLAVELSRLAEAVHNLDQHARTGQWERPWPSCKPPTGLDPLLV